MKRFKDWLYSETASNKNLLLLIHPDCAFELGADFCFDYTNKITNHAKKFDYVISHFFWPKAMIKHIKSQRSQREFSALEKIIEAVRITSDITTPQNGPDDCTYNLELPEYLINNENVNIFMAGGYEDNCLWRSYIDMFKKLDWLLKEKNTVVKWYEPLIFKAKDYKLIKSSRYDVEFDRKNLKSVDAKPSTFDPRKVDYGEPNI